MRWGGGFRWGGLLEDEVIRQGKEVGGRGGCGVAKGQKSHTVNGERKEKGRWGRA